MTAVEHLRDFLAASGILRPDALVLANRIMRDLGGKGYAILPATTDAAIERDGKLSQLIIRGLSRAQASEAIDTIFECIDVTAES